jgi:hypothetical protein
MQEINEVESSIDIPYHVLGRGFGNEPCGHSRESRVSGKLLLIPPQSHDPAIAFRHAARRYCRL